MGGTRFVTHCPAALPPKSQFAEASLVGYSFPHSPDVPEKGNTLLPGGRGRPPLRKAVRFWGKCPLGTGEERKNVVILSGARSAKSKDLSGDLTVLRDERRRSFGSLTLAQDDSVGGLHFAPARQRLPGSSQFSALFVPNACKQIFSVVEYHQNNVAAYTRSPEPSGFPGKERCI